MLGREDQPPPGYAARQPKIESGKQTAVIDVSDDIDQETDSSGEYTGASLTKPEMPKDFTICGAFRMEAWTTPFSKCFSVPIEWEGWESMGVGYYCISKV